MWFGNKVETRRPGSCFQERLDMLEREAVSQFRAAIMGVSVTRGKKRPLKKWRFLVKFDMACQQILCIFTHSHTHSQRMLAYTHMHVSMVSPSEAGFLADMSDSFGALVQRLWEGERDILLFTAQWCLLSLPLYSLTHTHRLLLHITLDVTLFPFGHFSSFTCLSSDCAFCSPTCKHTHSCSIGS